MHTKKLVFVLLTVAMLWSCKNDDDNNPERVPPRLLSEVAAEDNQTIISYLETHFYNYEEFASPPMDFDYKIVIDTIAGDNASKTPLMSQVQSASISVSSRDEFGLDEDETIAHTYYYLIAREGVGASPSVADSTFVRYEGSLLNGNSFDGSTNTPIWFDLSQIQAPLGGARGFTEGMVNFKSGGTPIVNEDGTFEVENYGVGMMIFPSGLGFFNSIQGSIPQYSPLIFKIDLFTMEQADHDDDGIPSIDEDVNGDGYLYNDNTDEQEEEDRQLRQRFVNFLDADDDGDGVSTRDEISDSNGNIIIPYPDTDGDGTPDYLDGDS